MLEFGFSDALNRIKLEVPIPGDPEPKSRLCNIFNERVLRKLGVAEAEKPRKEKSEGKKLPTQATLNSLDDLVGVYLRDEPLTEKECGVCGYVKPTAWEAETVKGEKIAVCEDCVQAFRKLRGETHKQGRKARLNGK